MPPPKPLSCISLHDEHVLQESDTQKAGQITTQKGKGCVAKSRRLTLDKSVHFNRQERSHLALHNQEDGWKTLDPKSVCCVLRGGEIVPVGFVTIAPHQAGKRFGYVSVLFRFTSLFKSYLVTLSLPLTPPPSSLQSTRLLPHPHLFMNHSTGSPFIYESFNWFTIYLWITQLVYDLFMNHSTGSPFI